MSVSVILGKRPETRTTTMPDVIGVDGDLELHLLGEQHVETYADLVDANRDFLGSTQEWARDFNLETARREFPVFRGMINRNEYAPYLISHNGEYKGIASMHGHKRQHTQAGYWLAESAQGTGLATRATRILIEIGFLRWGLERVDLQIRDDNSPSIAVAKRLGAERLNWNVKRLDPISGLQDYGVWRISHEE